MKPKKEKYQKRKKSWLKKLTGEVFDIVEDIFTAPTREQAESIIEKYSTYWMEIVGTRGFKGKKSAENNAMANGWPGKG